MLCFPNLALQMGSLEPISNDRHEIEKHLGQKLYKAEHKLYKTYLMFTSLISVKYCLFGITTPKYFIQKYGSSCWSTSVLSFIPKLNIIYWNKFMKSHIPSKLQSNILIIHIISSKPDKNTKYVSMFTSHSFVSMCY